MLFIVYIRFTLLFDVSTNKKSKNIIVSVSTSVTVSTSAFESASHVAVSFFARFFNSMLPLLLFCPFASLSLRAPAGER